MELMEKMVIFAVLFVMVSIAGSIYHYFNSYLFSDNGLDVTVNEVVADAVSQSGRDDLEISEITGLSCLERTSGSKIMTRIYDCAAMAQLDDGKSTPICITRTKHYRKVKKRRYSTRTIVESMDVNVNLCGIDSNIKSSKTVSRKWFF